MQIAFILPSLANRGPILVVRDLISELVEMGYSCNVFYFDDIKEIEFSAAAQKISFKTRFNFEGFDVVHSHGLRPDIFIYKNRSNISAVCLSTMHNIIIEEYRSAHNYLYALAVQKVWTFFLRRHDALVCLTEQMRDYYKKFFKADSIFIVYNGRNIKPVSIIPSVDEEKIRQFKKKYKILGAACVVIKRKGLHQVINALPLLKNYAFILIGDGPELENLRSLAKKLNVDERCLFLGIKEQAYGYYKYFDLFVMSSYAEGLPLSLLEAAAVKLPALCSNIAVLKEIFNACEVSFFDLDDVRSFIRAAEHAMNGYSDYAIKINRCYEAKFTAKRMAVNYQTVYNDLIFRKEIYD